MGAKTQKSYAMHSRDLRAARREYAGNLALKEIQEQLSVELYDASDISMVGLGSSRNDEVLAYSDRNFRLDRRLEVLLKTKKFLENSWWQDWEAGYLTAQKESDEYVASGMGCPNFELPKNNWGYCGEVMEAFEDIEGDAIFKKAIEIQRAYGKDKNLFLVDADLLRRRKELTCPFDRGEVLYLEDIRAEQDSIRCGGSYQ